MQAVLVEPRHPRSGGGLDLLPRAPSRSDRLAVVQADGALHQRVVMRGADPPDAAIHAVIQELLADALPSWEKSVSIKASSVQACHASGYS